MRTTSLALAAAAALLACSPGKDESARARVFSHEDRGRPAEAPFDWSHPEAALALSPDAAVRRIGAFDWSAAVEWTVSRGGDPPRVVHVTERHRVREAANGEFDVEDEIDPGLGDGSDGGRHVVFAGGMTYARSRYAPSGQFRERPTDRGRDARRYRDESFGLAADLARLCGPALALEPAGEATVLGRTARRFKLALARGAPPAQSPADGRTFPSGGPDADTKRRLALLEGAAPIAIDGELLADAETGVPLRTRLRATFGVKDDPAARVQVEVAAQVRAVGAAVAAVTAPKGALPDARKPPGVSGALEAAGLKQHGEAPGGRADESGDDD